MKKRKVYEIYTLTEKMIKSIDVTKADGRELCDQLIIVNDLCEDRLLARRIRPISEAAREIIGDGKTPLTDEQQEKITDLEQAMEELLAGDTVITGEPIIDIKYLDGALYRVLAPFVRA